MTGTVLYRAISTVKAGGYDRFRIEYTPDEFPTPSIWVKVKNTQSIALRAAYLTGPYMLYVDCRPDDYNCNQKCFISADQPVFEPQLLPGQSFYCELSCHTMKERHGWTLDVVSQILFNTAVSIDVEVTIGTTREVLKEETQKHDRKVGQFVPTSLLTVHRYDWQDLWNLPLPDPTKPIHLVILTHGLHSTASADLMYLKEQIDATAKDNVCVKAFFGNVGKTERGIKYLGSRVAEYIVDLVTTNSMFLGKVKKISFVGHSLGGLVQLFAIAYLRINFPWFFDDICPMNFITIASPLLGVANENPVYINLALNAGVLGRTGHDLGLKHVDYNGKPLLLLLPGGATHQVLKKFRRRTVYANAINDGIVPLRTSALLYLDYDELVELYKNSQEKVTTESGQTNTAKVPNEEESSTFSMQSMLSFFMPSKTQSTTSEDDSVNQSGAVIEGIPTSSVIESMPNVLLPPLPSMKYINDPDTRKSPILHDRIYDESDLPPISESSPKHEPVPRDESHDGYIKSAQREVKKILKKVDFDLDDVEDAIAREYHRDMSWRKVIVSLKPDAHNNIIVRRRFSNAYGWPVIDHVVANHFDADDEPESLEIFDSIDGDIGLSTIMSRDVIALENEQIDRASLAEEEDMSEHHLWINSNDGESFFAAGPSGLLADVSSFVGSLKEGWVKETPLSEVVPPVETDNEAIMGSFS